MPNRYPLIVNPSANQIQEIPAADALDLTGNDLIVTGITSLATVRTGNINSSGIVTATTFVGNLTGTATTSTISQGLTGTPNVSVGIVTASSVNTTSLSVSGVSTLGIVTSGNVFSTGIITASGGFNIGISSGGTQITSGPVRTLNFIGAGNTIAVNGTTVDISIQGSAVASSQWVTVSSGIYTGSNVGIATTNPIYPLQINSGSNIVAVTGIGSVGIGTTNPITKLHVVGDINLDDGAAFTTTLQTITPTANRTVSIPDATGTLALVAGSSGQITYNNAGANAGASGFTYNIAPQTLTVSAASTTTSSPILNLSQTWNAGAVAFTGVQLNITDTASAAGSLLEDWQVNGSSRFEFLKSGLSYYYNTSTDVTNYERAKFGWESNILRVGTERLGTGSARGLELQTDGTSRITITSTGNVGIQTTVPIQPFQVNPTGTSVIVATSTGNVGLGTTTPSSRLTVIGDSLITGISTVGLASTSSPSVNSTMSFELTNDTTLTVRVRGSDGTVRTGTITLS